MPKARRATSTKFVVETKQGATESGRRVSYELERVVCGKRCGTCRAGPAHGPYWYAYWTSGRRTRKRYIGTTFRALTDEEMGTVEARVTGSGATEIPVLGNDDVDELVDGETLPKSGRSRAPAWGRFIVRGRALWQDGWAKSLVQVEGVRGNKAHITAPHLSKRGKWVRIEQLSML